MNTFIVDPVSNKHLLFYQMIISPVFSVHVTEFKDISTKEKYWIRKTKTVLTSYSILLIIYSFLYICYLFICLRHHSLFFEKPTFNTTLKPIATITIHLFTNNHR